MTSASTLKVVKRTIIWLLLVCELVQYFIDQSFNNNVCAFIAMIASVLTIIYVFETRRFKRAPLSCIMILGFNISALSGALIIQTGSMRSIIFNLDVEFETFTSLLFTQILIIIIHYLYVHSISLRKLRAALSYRVFRPLGLLDAPSNAELWVFGFVGCVVTIISAHSYTDAIQYGDVSSKFALGYVPFAVAPFFIPMRAFVLGDTSGSKTSTLPIVGYALLLITVAMANNARATFSSGFLTLGLCCLIAVLSGNFALTPRRVRSGLMAVAIAIPIFTTLSDLATAMVIARDERSNVSSLELIEITLSNFQDKQLIEERRHRDAVVAGGEYNENYINNPILARFVYVKFVDVNMNNALRLSDSQTEEIRQKTRARLISMLPTPVINYFKLDVDKMDLGFSSGDLYSYIARGIELGGYTTGSEIPDGITIFGAMFWPVLCLLVLLQFLIYDSFCMIDSQGRLHVGALVLLNIVPIFTLGVMQESVSNQLVSIIRGVPQLIVLYLLLRIASLIVLRPIGALARLGTSVRARLGTDPAA